MARHPSRRSNAEGLARASHWRQQAGLVSGLPTTRRFSGKREIDVYRDGLMFEKDNVVGVTKR